MSNEEDPAELRKLSRWFVFTDNKADEAFLRSHVDSGYVRWMAYEPETAPSTGKAHLQGYMYTPQPHSSLAVRKKMKMWAKPMKGSLASNEAYCSKEGKWTEYGTCPAQGERTDILQLRDHVLSGAATVSTILEEQPHMHHIYGRTLTALEDLFQSRQSRNFVTQAIWLYGPTGQGKTRVVWDTYPHEKIYNYKDDNGWWENYRGQEVCLMDDFRGAIPYHQLLKLADRYPYEVRRRNRAPAPFVSRIIIVTSACPPAEVYHNLSATDNLDQLFRRFTVIKVENGQLPILPVL